MVFEKFTKKKDRYSTPQVPPPIQQVPQQPSLSINQIVEELRTYLANISSTVSRIETGIRELEDRVDRLEKTIQGYFIIQVSHVPSTLSDLVKLLGLRAGAILKNNMVIERAGELFIDPTVIASSIEFDNILHMDRSGIHIYMLKIGEKSIYVEADRELDYCVLSIIKKFLEFF